MTSDDRTDLPVLLVHNIDPEWPEEDVEYARTQALGVAKALRNVGHRVTSVSVRHPNLRRLLRRYSPEDYVVFNWCEALPGVEHWSPWWRKNLRRWATRSAVPRRVLELSCNKAAHAGGTAARRVPVPEGSVFDELDGAKWDRFPAIVKAAYRAQQHGHHLLLRRQEPNAAA